MAGPEESFRDALRQWFLPGAVYTFVGAGGKTTAMKRVAAFLAGAGMKARLTTTTRVGIEELRGIPVTFVKRPEDMPPALAGEAPLRLLVAGVVSDVDKYLGIDPALIESLSLPGDTVLLVEGDGSRRCPLKVPRDHEPVIPANTRTVFALMGASAIDEPIDEIHCYNHQKALSLIGKADGSFDPEVLATLCADPQGCRKGVRAGMDFRFLINQGISK